MSQPRTKLRICLWRLTSGCISAIPRMDPPPPPNLPVEPTHLPIRHRLEPILPPPLLPGVYVASDGTVLTLEKTADGQITGFSGTGKDGNNYSLTTAIVTEKAPGRQAAVDVLWLKASLSITVGGSRATAGFRFPVRPNGEPVPGLRRTEQCFNGDKRGLLGCDRSQRHRSAYTDAFLLRR
jgi:hypothetical protein